MKRRRLIVGMALSLSISAWAGGLLTNTNQSIHFLRNPARDASTEIDAAYTNPAGLSLLPSDGFYFSVNNQSAFQTRTIVSTYAPFAGFGGSATKKFEGKASAPIIPSLQVAYKTGRWVVSANLSVSGGGGKATFNEGLPSFESTLAIVPTMLSSYGMGGYSLNSYMEGSSFIYGAQLGGTYAINEQFSAYAGFRLNIVNNSYEGYLRDMKIGINGQLTPTSMIASDPRFAQLAPLLTEKELLCEQSGWGVTPVIGINFNWNRLNIGAKYEANTHLNVENKTEINTTGVEDYQEGVNTPHDIPALFTIGAKYDIIDPVTVSVGYHHFFDSNAKMSNNKQKHIDGGINEFLAGVEYRINRLFLISCGGQITRTGVQDAYQTDLSYSLNSYSVGFGGAVNVSDNVRINIAYFFTNYEDWTKESADYGGISAMTGGMIPAIKGTDVFGRTNKTFGVGIDFRF